MCGASAFEAGHSLVWKLKHRRVWVFTSKSAAARIEPPAHPLRAPLGRSRSQASLATPVKGEVGIAAVAGLCPPKHAPVHIPFAAPYIDVNHDNTDRF